MREKNILCAGGALAMGAGIWSMHFIGMLSYKMKMAITYDPSLTLLSMLVAIAFSYGVLRIIARKELTFPQIATGAVLLGFGICGMHYIGMAAMQMDADLRYVPHLFVLSVVIAMTASGAALAIAFHLPRHAGRFRDLLQLFAAIIMGAAICGMHYVGMAAAVFLPWADCRYDPQQNFDLLAFAIAGMTSLVLGIALVFSIYRRRQSDILLQSSEIRLRAMIENAQDAVIAFDKDGHVTEWNKQAEAIFGWSHREAIGGLLSDMIIPRHLREAHNAGMKHFIETGTGPILNTRIEVQAVNRAGAVFPVELTVSAHKLPDGYHFTAFVRDITERKKAEAQISRYMHELEHSNQELEAFAHIASHDLKEPLRGLYSQASFILEDYKDKLDEKGVHRLHRLHYLAKRMERLVSDLLYFSQLGQMELAIQETDPNALIHEIRQMLDLLLKEKNARIVVPHLLPVIICDKPRVTEVFRNLITNAIKYNDKPEPVVEIGFLDKVDTTAGVEHNVFYVKDNGIGIEPMFHEEIFQIFKRLDHGVEEKESGTGVGLTFVKKIIERHHGRIWLDSEQGKGTTFYFTLHRAGGEA
jgi:PAS domain S-box-containing protein